MPREVYQDARAYFDEEAFLQLPWAIVAVNAWNRMAVATRALPGEYQPE